MIEILREQLPVGILRIIGYSSDIGCSADMLASGYYQIYMA